MLYLRALVRKLIPVLCVSVAAGHAAGSAGTVGPAFPAIAVYETLPGDRLLAIDHGVLIQTDKDGARIVSFHSEIDFGAVTDAKLVTARSDADGSLFVAGDFVVNDGRELANLAKLRPDGSLDPDFRPIAVIDYLKIAGGIVSLAPDGLGGCFFGGNFDYDRTGHTDTLDPRNWRPLANLAHADRFGNVTPILRDLDFAQRIFGAPRRLIRDGDSIVAVTYAGLYRVYLDGRVEPFTSDSTVMWATRGQSLSSCYDPVYGLAVAGLGRVAGLAADWQLVAVYNLDGSIRSSFQQQALFGSGAGGSGAMVWDHQGRLVLGWITDGSVFTLESLPDGEGNLNGTRLRSTGPGTFELENVLEGFPELHTMRRLLPDGSLDPVWSRALWSDLPIYKIDVLPGGDLVVFGGASICGFPSRGVVRLMSEPQYEQQPQQSVRARLDPGGEPLIMGIVIPGDTARDVLIRAVGPSLAQFGVENPAYATRLHVFQGGRRIVTAGRMTNTRPVQQATKRVGAFALEVVGGGSEGQALLQLPPGAYTVQIELDGDTTPQSKGSAVLGEIYFP